MLLYNTTSQSSFDRILSYSHEVLKVGNCVNRPILVVGAHYGQDPRHRLTNVGERLAHDLGGRFIQTKIDDADSISAAFQTLLLSYWRESTHRSLKQNQEQKSRRFQS